MPLSASDQYVVVFTQHGSESVTLDSTTSGDEDSTGLSGWSIRNKFYWNNAGTWQEKGGTNESIQIDIRGYERPANSTATGSPRVLYSVDEAGILYADTFDIRDADGLPFEGEAGSSVKFNKYDYQWVRVDGSNENQHRHRFARVPDSRRDIGKQIKVKVTFKDAADNAESLTSVPVGPITEPPPPPSSKTLVSNTGQSNSTTLTVSEDYAQGFTLGDHRPGLRDLKRLIDLASAPSNLTVSLWIAGYADVPRNSHRASCSNSRTPPPSRPA